ncbi:MAG TPA: cytochrome c [Verrucomicrobiae bacterium]|nr:cytochrome c [Verrucomicrobiae bacterium]
MRHLISIVLIGAALGAAIVGIAGLRGSMSRKPPIEIFPDMNRQQKLRPMVPDGFFQNGVSSQLPPPGTISRGDREDGQPVETVSGPVYAFEDAPVNTGLVTGTTNFVATNPLPVTPELLQRGREHFDIYCSPCHGRLGDGNGITKKIGDMPTVVSLHDKRVVDMPDGEIFHTITHGKGVMGAYGPLVATQDRWAIVAYLRALQLSWLGTTNDLTAAQQSALK